MSTSLLYLVLLVELSSYYCSYLSDTSSSFVGIAYSDVRVEGVLGSSNHYVLPMFVCYL
jgi:hypothetical protein